MEESATGCGKKQQRTQPDGDHHRGEKKTRVTVYVALMIQSCAFVAQPRFACAHPRFDGSFETAVLTSPKLE